MNEAIAVDERAGHDADGLFLTRAIAEQLRQRLRLGNDREEVGVGRPARHKVLVQVPVRPL